MHGRTFLALCATAFALTALSGVLMGFLVPSHADHHGLLLAFLLAVAFASAAWLEPSPRTLCRACGRGKGVGLDFCASCGAPVPGAAESPS